MIEEIKEADIGLPAQLLLLVPEEEVGSDGGVDEVRLVLGGSVGEAWDVTQPAQYT